MWPPPPNGSEPIVIVLNGAPSSGKTSTARAMQHPAAIPLIRIGIDDLFAACPEPWAAADAGPPRSTASATCKAPTTRPASSQDRSARP